MSGLSGGAASAANLFLIAAAVVWILVRQVRTERLKPGLLLVAPLLLGYFGVRSAVGHNYASAVDVALLAASALASVGLGLWRGATVQVWRDQAGVWWRRGSWRTLALWGALFAVRGVTYAVAYATGHREASALGLLLVFLGVSFAAQNAVIGLRMVDSSPAGRAVGA